YRKATERAISGDWNKFEPKEFFSNILISSSRAGIDEATAHIEATARRAAAEANEILEIPDQRTEPAGGTENRTETAPESSSKKDADQGLMVSALSDAESGGIDRAEAAAWRSLFGSLMKMTYGAAVDAFLDFVSERFKLNSVIWLDVKNCEFHLASAIGRLRGKPLRLGIRPGDERLRAYAGGERPYQLKEKRKQPRIAAESSVLNVFPVTVGGEVRGALAFEGELGDPSAARRIARFCQAAAP
ncbi:MAG: hypothetical protein C4325_12740, partial [Blastocatellia bacterium]